MAVYTIQRDPPWQPQKPQARMSRATTASHYSDDDDEDPDVPEIQPLRVLKSQPQQIRHSRLPLFKHVRSMLHRPPLTNPVPGDQDADSAANAFRAAYETPGLGHRSSDIVNRSRSPSPVSVLREDGIYPSSPPQLERSSPVSPISEASSDNYAREHNMRPMQLHVPLPKTQVPIIVKRKPAPNRQSISSANVSPPPSRDINSHEYIIRGSHFSWTTGAPSPTSTLPPSDIWSPASTPYQTPRSSRLPEADTIPNSRFSWTTVGTQQTRPETPPPSPPPVPTKYTTPPVQSILSRHRPVQRIDREQWAPPSRKASLPNALSTTPTSTKPKLSMTSSKAEESSGSGKKLPLPPDMTQPESPMTRLESLQRAEQDKSHQRKNILRVISELSRVESASPMEVPFAHVRDAKRRLVELKATLSEIELEEREIGIAISRARRKEGEEEGLWVRRVTG